MVGVWKGCVGFMRWLCFVVGLDGFGGIGGELYVLICMRDFLGQC